MLRTFFSFSSLYFATLLMMSAIGLFNTYMGLRLTQQAVSELWIGTLIAAYYLGLMSGARFGHKLIIRVGHIRAFTACAAVTTAMVLLQSLVDYMPIWLLFRLVAGLAMVTQFMVLESWLNEQSDNQQRGQVFSFYMLASGLGVVLGQLALTAFPVLDLRPLALVAVCMVMCLVPIAVTRRVHPPSPLPAPLDLKFFAARIPLSLTAIFIAGNLSGAFYGLAPVYAAKFGLSTPDVALFVAAGVTAGLLSQWPIGWLSDRINRAGLIRFNSLLLMVLAAFLWGWISLPFWLMLVLSAVLGVLQFTLYPLGAAFANDHVEHERRVGLSAVLLITYGLGACIGPLIAGALMSWQGPGMYFVFISVCAAILVWQVRPTRVSGAHQVDEAPVQFVPMPDSLQSSAVAAALDPRVDLDIDTSMDGVVHPQDADTASVPEDGVVFPSEPVPEAVAAHIVERAGDNGPVQPLGEVTSEAPPADSDAVVDTSLVTPADDAPDGSVNTRADDTPDVSVSAPSDPSAAAAASASTEDLAATASMMPPAFQTDVEPAPASDVPEPDKPVRESPLASRLRTRRPQG